ncbi:bacterio-opsin activator HTH domain-containing protein [Haloferax elongans ATCC BAA-1513]|uniref:Bacterio-opsin activator HTH domain-containing protein n=1 Tax=Haloferax elongans ATCC BAA-1513 TaxID=1230453 RepID=M0HFF5_HALEO|nr:helix-turn-helix domain-containing protein [Haloferax elongans]ELZ81824.1 bacterio-opsin activator HTH domain-containing protein [Haloferax elongans ATCC BAA-1513]
MSVIAHLRIPASSFELGRILEMEGGTSIVLENLVPLGEKAVPFFTVHDASRDAFEKNVRKHPSVESIREVSKHNSQTLYALGWAVSRDLFFQAIVEADAQLLSATGTSTTWEFELRFPTHTALSEFQESCSNGRIPLEVGRIYNPTKPGTGPWYGLTNTQRDTLMRAVQGGYYSIPRRMSTKDLAEAFDISDQAVTERLRRAIITLVENTLVAAMDDEFEAVD